MTTPTEEKNNNIEFFVQRPFGPSIGCCKLPQDLVDDFNKDCDTVIKSEKESKARDVSHELAGNVKQQLSIDKEVFAKWAPLFMKLINKYLKAHPQERDLPKSLKTTFTAAWYVRSFAGDFNPAHYHSNCHLSCVGYLALPEGIKKEWAEEDKQHVNASSAGAIEIQYGESHLFSKNVVRIRPKVGDYYLFPWWMAHMVYPFRAKGERRSFAFNIALSLLEGAEKEFAEKK